MKPSCELAQFLVGRRQLDQRSLEVLLGFPRVGVERPGREVDRVRDGDEVLLGAIVEVPLEPLSLRVAGRDYARPRAPDLLLA